jgi:hypothetical protein
MAVDIGSTFYHSPHRAQDPKKSIQEDPPAAANG